MLGKRVLAFLLCVIMITFVIFSAPAIGAQTVNNNSTFTINVECHYDEAFEVLKRVNDVRKSKGLSALSMNTKMLNSAMQRAAEIAVNFEHERPDGSSCFTINSDIKAENIGVVYRNPEEMVQGWCDSKLHYANIVAKSYKTAGIGAITHNGERYWVMVFGTITSGTTTTVPKNTDRNYTISVGSYKYDLTLDIRDKLFVTDETNIRVVGKNYCYDREFVVNNSCFTVSSADKNVITASGSKVTALAKGSSKITAKGDCATITKTISVSEFGEGKSRKCGDNVTWEYNNGVLSFSGYGDMYDYNTEYDHYGITSSDVLWVDGADIVSKVVINEGITSVSNSAFACFSNLSEISLSQSLTKIGDKAFACCKNLSSITFPDNISVIGSSAFYKCSGFTQITLPNNLKELSNSVFYNCTNLKSISIPESVEKISQSALSYCTSLTTLTLPESLKAIDGYAFFGCSGLKNITIGFEVERIGKKAFSGCSNLSKVIVKNPTVIFEAENIFADTKPEMVIHSYKNSSAQTFCKDNSLAFKAIDSSTLTVNATGYTVVYNGEAVTENPNVSAEGVDGQLRVKYSKGKDFDYHASFESIEELGNFHRKGAVGYERDQKYLIDSGVYTISYSAYADGYAPVFGNFDIEISKAQTNLSFEHESMNIPWYSKGDNTGGFINTLSGLGDLKPTDLTFTSSDTTVLILDRTGKMVPKKYGNVTVSVSFEGDENHKEFSGQYDVTIYPVGVVIIGDYTCEFFEDGTVAINRYLGKEESLNIPVEILKNKLRKIGTGAFKGCAADSIVIPQGVTTLGENSFVSCYNLTDLSIPDTVTEISAGAFSGCRKLVSVTIPSTVTTIGERAFGYTAMNADGECQKIESFVIFGYKNTAAEKYAIENGIDFVELKDESVLIGDVDGDGELSIIDVTAIQLHIARIKQFDESIFDIADVTGDGSIDIMDATAIQLKLVGKG